MYAPADHCYMRNNRVKNTITIMRTGGCIGLYKRIIISLIYIYIRINLSVIMIFIVHILCYYILYTRMYKLYAIVTMLLVIVNIRRLMQLPRTPPRV